jgi:hypothetical protein
VTTVVEIGGSGRNGSTLVDRVLGQLPGVVAVGELVHLPQRGLIDDELCGCGEPFGVCAFWRAVGKRAVGGWDRVDGRELRALQLRVDRNRFIPWLATGHGRSPAAARDLTRWTAFLTDLYRAIADESGCGVVVDASKHVSTAFVLRRVPGVELRVLHLTRDSRGVAHSWAKTVARPEARPGSAEGGEMLRLSPLDSSLRWVAYNAAFDALRLASVPVTSVRYEDVVADVDGELRRAWSALGLGELASLDAVVGDGFVELAATHSVAGNPSRFRTGRIPLRSDDAWRTEMPRGARRVVTWSSAPLLVRHGYTLRGDRP